MENEIKVGEKYRAILRNGQILIVTIEKIIENMHETYLQNEREWEEQFEVMPEHKQVQIDWIKDFNRLSLIKVMKALEKELEGEKKEIPLIWKIVKKGSAAQLAKRDRENFNEGLQLSLDKIREFISKLEKEV